MFRSDDTHEVCLVWGQRYDSKRNYPRFRTVPHICRSWQMWDFPRHGAPRSPAFG
jgi:hypothetical protein